MELRNYLNLIRKWWWLVVISAAVAGVVAFFVSRQQTPIYQATSTVLINQARSPSGSPNYTELITSERIARTYSDMLQDWPVLQRAAQELGYQEGYGALDRAFDIGVAVSPVRDTQLVRLSVTSSNPELAAKLANTLPVVFAEMNRERQLERFEETRRELETELQNVELLLARGEGLAPGEDNPTGLDQDVAADVDAARLQTLYTSLLDSLAELRLAEAQSTDDIVVTTPAQVSTTPIRPRVLFNTLLAALIGALLAIGVIFLVEYLDDTVKNPDDIREQTGLTTLAAVITIKGTTPQERLAIAMGSKSPAAEAYRVLRTNLQFSSLDKPLRSLLVTSPSPGEGKTTTAANLAIIMAQTGQQVVLLDCDLRRPSIHHMFQLPNNTGLTTALLQANTAAAEFLRDTSISNLKLMTTGPVPPNPAELLGSGRMHELLDQLQNEANIVIIDSPPVLAVADSAILSTHSDGTVLVVSAGETRFDVLTRALERLHGVGVRPLGVVLNKLSERRTGYYYYYDYRYASTYAEDDRDDGDDKGSRWRRGRLRRSPTGKVGEQVS